MAQAKKSGSNSKIILLVGALVVAIALVVGGTMYYNQQKAANEARIVAEAKKAAAEKKAKAKKLEAKRMANDPIYKSYQKFGLTYAMTRKARTLPVTAIGDSVMLGSQYGLEEIFKKINVDASVSRQAYEGADLVDQAHQNGTLAKNLVISLGTNGNITKDDLKSIRKAAGSDTDIFWITIDVDRDWEEPNNKALAAAADKYSNFHLIDWKKLATEKGDPSWFSADGVHPSVKGQEYYYTLIAKTVLKYSLDDED